jgi:hypothetical protein
MEVNPALNGDATVDVPNADDPTTMGFSRCNMHIDMKFRTNFQISVIPIFKFMSFQASQVAREHK